MSNPLIIAIRRTAALLAGSVLGGPRRVLRGLEGFKVFLKEAASTGFQDACARVPCFRSADTDPTISGKGWPGCMAERARTDPAWMTQGT